MNVIEISLSNARFGGDKYSLCSPETATALDQQFGETWIFASEDGICQTTSSCDQSRRSVGKHVIIHVPNSLSQHD